MARTGSSRRTAAGQAKGKPGSGANRRTESGQQRREARRRRTTLIAVGLVLLVGLAVGVGAVVFNPAGPATAQALVYVPDEGRTHVQDGSPITYRTIPPASGPHYPSPEAWGIYSTEVEEGYWVHNLEHGGIVLLYKCEDGCAKTVAEIKAIDARLPRSKWGNVKFLATPYTEMESPFTLVAWDRQQALSALDEDAIRSFYRTFVDQGPEDSR